MELTLIYRACFLVVLNIISFKGHYCYLLVCYGNYNYRTARFECENIGGIMVTMDTVDIYKDALSEKIFCRGINKQKFWLKKMQGLSSSNFSSFSCNTEVDNCPYFEMTNDKILCKETNCDRKFHFLCEKADEPMNFRHCISLSTFSAPRALGRAKVDNPSTSDITTPAERTTVPKSQPTKIFQTDKIGNLRFFIGLSFLFLTLSFILY